MTTKEVCDRYRITRKFLRYYEEQGILAPLRDDHEKVSFRNYGPEDLQTIEKILQYRSMDLTVSEIREVFESEKSGKDPSAALKTILQKKREMLQKQLESLAEDNLPK